MIKNKIFNSYVGTSTSSMERYNKEVQNFTDNLSVEGHTFISINTIAFGSEMQFLRTEIIFRENQKRTVITEKSSG